MPNNREGQRVPRATFRARDANGWKDVTTDELFGGKRVVVFALPGAFTPTCSSSHVPRYNELAPAFRERGIDSIICLSVNDAFVMDEWAKSQHADQVTFIPDGNGEFAAGMNMLVDKRNLGFGQRSWRYSMLVDDGVIKKMFIEPEREGDPYEVSDADTMLRYLDPERPAPPDILLFTKPGCEYCAKAKNMLGQRGLAYEEVDATPRRLRAVSGRGSTPQVFIDGTYIGGCNELEKYLAKPG
jgi:glutathione-dependent peroxiredoxin